MNSSINSPKNPDTASVWRCSKSISICISSHFTIPKNYFINYTIPLYNTLNIPKFYFFSILFKYSILFYFYYFSFSIPFPLFLLQPLAPVSTHRAPHTHWPMIHRSTYPNPSSPPPPHTHTHTQKQKQKQKQKPKTKTTHNPITTHTNPPIQNILLFSFIFTPNKN